MYFGLPLISELEQKNLPWQINVCVVVFLEKRVYYRVTIPFTTKPILAEAPYSYYDCFWS